MKKSHALKIIVRIIVSNIRNVKFAATKLVAIELLNEYSMYLSDKDNLTLVLPYLT